MKVFFGLVPNENMLDIVSTLDLFYDNGKYYYYCLVTDDEGNAILKDTAGRYVPLDYTDVAAASKAFDISHRYTEVFNDAADFVELGLADLEQEVAEWVSANA